MTKDHKHCRVCGSTRLTEYLDLGMMPLSNNLLNSWKQGHKVYPLKVMFCEDCYLSQLSIVVDKEELFGHYVYRSSISDSYKAHCREMACYLTDSGLARPSKNFSHIDIAGNDGALLKEFYKLWGHNILNVDPAENLAPIARLNGVPTYEAYWGIKTAQYIYNSLGPVQLITATNVFAHVDNVHEFLQAILLLLADDGVAVLEFPYILDFIDKQEFDTVYFEHLSYFGIGPLKKLCDAVGLTLLEVKHHEIHGGSVRCVLVKSGSPASSVKEYLNVEKYSGFNDLATYKFWAQKVDTTIRQFRAGIKELSLNNVIWGFAASAKGNTLLNAAGIKHYNISHIVDQTPEKIGKYSPGTGIQIVDMDALIKIQPDYLVLLSWNFDKEIIAKCRAAGYKGKFIYPLTMRIV